MFFKMFLRLQKWLAVPMQTKCRYHYQDGEEKMKAFMQSIFTQLMSASKDVISKALSKLKSRLTMASLELLSIHHSCWTFTISEQMG